MKDVTVRLCRANLIRVSQRQRQPNDILFFLKQEFGRRHNEREVLQATRRASNVDKFGPITGARLYPSRNWREWCCGCNNNSGPWTGESIRSAAIQEERSQCLYAQPQLAPEENLLDLRRPSQVTSQNFHLLQIAEAPVRQNPDPPLSHVLNLKDMSKPFHE